MRPTEAAERQIALNLIKELALVSLLMMVARELRIDTSRAGELCAMWQVLFVLLTLSYFRRHR
jgi:predicted MFS family arabinose efflux permease